jgi:hypothetical protein
MLKQIETFLKNYFQHLNSHDSAAIEKDWYAKGILCINGEVRPLSMIKSLPLEVGFELQKVELFACSDAVGIANVEWKMLMPTGSGNHHSSFTLLRKGKDWCILSQVDQGIENMQKA